MQQEKANIDAMLEHYAAYLSKWKTLSEFMQNTDPNLEKAITEK